MSWIILGLVFLAVTYLSLKGTIIEEYGGGYKVDEHYVSVWMLLVLGLFYIIPVLGILIFIAYNVVFAIYATREPVEWEHRYILKLSDKNVLHKILRAIHNFVTKPIK